MEEGKRTQSPAPSQEAAMRGKIHFLQSSDIIISTMLQYRPQEELANTEWTPWLFCPGVSFVVVRLFLLAVFFFLREREQKVG